MSYTMSSTATVEEDRKMTSEEDRQRQQTGHPERHPAYHKKKNETLAGKALSLQSKAENKRKYMKEYREKNKEKLAEYEKIYRQNNIENKSKKQKEKYKKNNIEKIKAAKEWYQKNKEKVKQRNILKKKDNQQYQKEYFQKNKEKITAKNKKWNEANKEKIKERSKERRKEKRKRDENEKKVDIVDLMIMLARLQAEMEDDSEGEKEPNRLNDDERNKIFNHAESVKDVSTQVDNPVTIDREFLIKIINDQSQTINKQSALIKELEHRKEKNRIANRKYKKSKKGKVSQKKAQQKYNSKKLEAIV